MAANATAVMVALATADDGGRRWPGTALITASAIAFSLAGLIDLDVWTVLFWRALFGGGFIAGYIVWREGRRVLPAIRQTGIASLVALVGAVVIISGALASGHLLGDLLALIMTILISAMMVIVRRNRDISMLPAACLSAFLCAVIVAPVSHPLAATAHDFLYLALFGTMQFGLGLLLLTLGTRLFSATRSALIGSLETPLAPAWVWLAVGEIPAVATVVGGLIVMAAVLGDILLQKSSAVPERVEQAAA
jgi:EamA-like transporter family protein